MTIQTSYLNAIQAVPGDTPGEKFRWIAKLIKERLSECNSLEDVVESDKIPRPLAPLIQVQAAIMLNKKNPGDQTAYGAIAEALKSQDELVVNKALQASSFFDGSNKTITSIQYFFDNLLPYVSLNTRTRIIKNLATHLAPKNSSLAEEFFTAVSTYYNLEQALPLLLACSESFMYNTIVEKRIVLSRKLVKQLFRKNPDFVVRYLRLSKPNTDPCARNLHPVNIYDFGDFLAALIKKRLASFVELYEMHEKVPPTVNLSNRCAEAFLKNGKEHLQRKPKLYINILPLRMISNRRMEAIYPKLFPSNITEFKTDRMLSYLQYYPQDKKVDLFLKSYKQNYDKNILDDESKVTVTLMKILPVEERVRQARTKLENEQNQYKGMDYTLCWTCYLPIKESIPQFMDEITRTAEMEGRSIIACKMIYSCYVNNDDQAFLEILTYLKNRHKNEQAWFLMKVFETMLKLYDLSQMGENYWTILLDMIVRAHVKKDLLVGNPISVKIVETAIHYKIIQNQSIDQMIDILVDLKSMRCTGFWNILTKYPEYERICLEACVNAVSQKYKSDKTPWKEDKVGILYDLCSSIYYFNVSHVTKTNRTERMSIKNYPWLVQAVEEILSTIEQKNVYIIENLQNILKDNEKELYERFWPKSQIAEVDNGEAYKVLKRSPEEILVHWKEYLKSCQEYGYRGHTKRFVKATRWYKDIPIKFVEQCIQDLGQKKEEACLNILAILVHGETFVKIIEPLIPINKAIDIQHEEAKTNYILVQHVIYGTKLANPPLPLTLIGRVCEGDYLSVALAGLINVCRRTNVMDVISFARHLASQRVSVRKHGIRVMQMVAPRDQLIEFLHAQWKGEENHTIREIIYFAAEELFRNEPDLTTWSLLRQIISTFTKKDTVGFSRSLTLIRTAPDEYVLDLIKLSLSLIDEFEQAEVIEWSLTSSLLSKINAAICNLLPEDFVKELIRRFLFHQDMTVARCASMLVLTALLHPAKEKFDDRMKIFSSVFTEVVKTGWNVPHPKNPRFYPVNNGVHRFIDVVTHTFFFLEMEPRLIEGILSTFLSVLQPEMDAASYLLLIYTREQVSVKTPQEFGVKLGSRMPELVNIFSSHFVFFMTDTLRYMLGLNAFKNYNKADATLGIIEGLMNVKSLETMLMAVKLLTTINSKEYRERYDKLMTKLSEHDHPAIKSIVCDIINKTSL